MYQNRGQFNFVNPANTGSFIPPHMQFHPGAHRSFYHQPLVPTPTVPHHQQQHHHPHLHQNGPPPNAPPPNLNTGTHHHQQQQQQQQPSAIFQNTAATQPSQQQPYFQTASYVPQSHYGVPPPNMTLPSGQAATQQAQQQSQTNGGRPQPSETPPHLATAASSGALPGQIHHSAPGGGGAPPPTQHHLGTASISLMPIPMPQQPSFLPHTMPTHQTVQITAGLPPQQPTQPPQQPKKRSNAIRIINPNTGEEINVLGQATPSANATQPISSGTMDASTTAIESGNSETEDSAKAKEVDQATDPVVKEKTNLAADFALRVAQAANTSKVNSITTEQHSEERIKNKKDIHSDKKLDDVNPTMTVAGMAASTTAEVVEKEASQGKREPWDQQLVSPKTTTSAAKEAVDGKSKVSSPKKSGETRKAEINRKGDEKMGSDMDVFTDLNEPSPKTTESIKPPQETTTEVEVNKIDEGPIATGDKNEDTAEGRPTEVASASDEGDKPSDEVPHADPDETAANKASAQPKLKYNYKEDQWSPINVEGKKQYDREFLMQLQRDPQSMMKPINLPNMEIIKDRANDKVKIPTNKTIDFMPSYVKPTQSKGGLITKKSSQNGGRKSDTPLKKIVISGLSIQEKVELHSAENAWKPRPIKDKIVTENGDADANEDLARKARSILNKLTPQKFDTLVQKFQELTIDNEEKLRLCMELIFEKAVDEPGFSVAYARMCGILQKKQVTTKDNAPVQFKYLLLTRCQQEFEKEYLEERVRKEYERDIAETTSEEKKKQLKLEFEEKERQARKRSLGNMRFIGELYKLKMLTAKIMHQCVQKLLKTPTDEEALECLCRLLTTVGKDLEQETNAKMAEFKNQSPALQQDSATLSTLRHFDAYFDKMQKIVDSKVTSSRVRFMLQDLIDLRKDKWKPRRDVAGPKTIDQIHKEVEREKTQQQLENLVAKSQPSMSGRQDGSGGRKRQPRGGPPNQDQEMGWTVQTNPRRQERLDAKQLTNSIHGIFSKQATDPDNMQLGPACKPYTHWGRGSGSAGSRGSQTKDDTAATTFNRFAYLNTSASFAGSAGASASSLVNDIQETLDASRRGTSRSAGVPGRSSRGPSADSERSKALQAVMDISQPNGPPGKAKQQQQSSRGPQPPLQLQQNQWSQDQGTRKLQSAPQKQHEDPKAVQADLLKGPSELDDVDNLTAPMIDKFLKDCDEKETTAYVCKHFHPNTMSAFVTSVITSVFDRSKEARQQFGKFFDHLVKKHIILPEQYEAGMCSTLELASDLLVDVPKLWDYLAEIIAPMLTHSTLSMTFLVNTSNSSLKNGDDPGAPGKYASAILNTLANDLGHVKVGEMWRKAGLNWEDFVSPEQVQQFIKANQLEFTSGSTNGPSVSLTLEQIKSQLQKMVAENENNAFILDWIDSNLGERAKEHSFIRVLTEVVISSTITGVECGQCELQKEKLEERTTLFKRFLDGDVEREKQALYALQRLMHSMEHPNKLLHQIFEALYQGDVLTDEAFEAWEKCDDPAEQEGKGVAIKSTTQFLTWLKEVDDDETVEDQKKRVTDTVASESPRQ